MQRKNVRSIVALLIVVGFATLSGLQGDSQTTNFFAEMIEVKVPTPHIPQEAYTGPQTVPALMDAFDTAYNQRYSKAKVIASRQGGGVYKSELAISGEIDARYPRAEWLQRLLDRGILIENSDDYRVYLSKRHTLAFLEDNPDLRKSGILGIPPTDNWETYKADYIEKLVKKHAQVQKVPEQVERAKAQIERAKAQIERAKAQVERTKAQIEHRIALEAPYNQRLLERIKAELERIKAELERTKPRLLERIKAELERTQTELERIKAELERTKPRLLEHIKAELERTQTELERIKAELERTKPLTPSPNKPNRSMKWKSRYPPL